MSIDWPKVRVIDHGGGRVSISRELTDGEIELLMSDPTDTYSLAEILAKWYEAGYRRGQEVMRMAAEFAVTALPIEPLPEDECITNTPPPAP